MKHFILIFGLSLFYFLSCSTEVQEEPISAEIITDDPEVLKDGKSLMWKISGENVTTSYMYGTMHMIDQEYYHFTENMRNKISDSEAIIMEVGGMPNPLEALAMMSLDSGDIRDCFTTEQMKQVVEFFDTKMDTDPKSFYDLYGSMKPFFIMQSISQTHFSENTESYDMDIMAIAAEKDIPLIGLETISQQLGFFDVIPKEAMAEMIISSIENYEKEGKDIKKLMKIYAQEKVDKLIPLINKQSPEFMEFEDVFLTNRNKAWIPKIMSEIKDKSCFIAVGAAHLFGDEGVIQLLKNEGLTVEAVATTWPPEAN